MKKKTSDLLLKILEGVVEVCGVLLMLLPFIKRPSGRRKRRKR
jgi:hypothetical protein